VEESLLDLPFDVDEVCPVVLCPCIHPNFVSLWRRTRCRSSLLLASHGCCCKWASHSDGTALGCTGVGGFPSMDSSPSGYGSGGAPWRISQHLHPDEGGSRAVLPETCCASHLTDAFVVFVGNSLSQRRGTRCGRCTFVALHPFRAAAGNGRTFGCHTRRKARNTRHDRASLHRWLFLEVSCPRMGRYSERVWHCDTLDCSWSRVHPPHPCGCCRRLGPRGSRRAPDPCSGLCVRQNGAGAGTVAVYCFQAAMEPRQASCSCANPPL